MDESLLRQLADKAGLLLEWHDSEGNLLHLSTEVMQHVLPKLGFPADSDAAVTESLEKLEQIHHPRSPADLPPLITAECGRAVSLPCALQPGTRFLLRLETGQEVNGELDAAGCIPAVDDAGYHRLQLGDADLCLAVAPTRCYTPADACSIQEARLWGMAAQLYSLRRPGDGGFGDALALQHLGQSAAGQGADAVAISPTHAMFSGDTARFSPYSPSSRLLRNALYCAPEGLMGKERVEAAQARCGIKEQLRILEAMELVDWPRAGSAKLLWLRALYDDVMGSDDARSEALRQQLDDYRQQGGEVLEDHCRFEAILAARGPGTWRDWPEELQHPRSTAVARFAEEHEDEVRFHAFLQWLAADGLLRAHSAMREAGMAVGIISDLAVGADDAGSQTWSRQDEMLQGLSIGAPPDSFNVHGQDWGLAAFSPHGLVQSGFRSFIDMLRAGFDQSGGLRIDHILGLMRMWLIPHGSGPDQGAYVRYPFDDLLRLVALESWRHRAIVIGEDLGTVAAGFSERLAEKGILGMKVLWFERGFERGHEGSFRNADSWSSEAMATTSTHDLPTVAGWWAGRDIEWRSSLGLLKADRSAEAEHNGRAKERAQLALALGLVAPHSVPEKLSASDLDATRVLDATARFMAQVPSPLTLLPVEDVLGLEEQANLPGTMDEHPNWRRRWSPDAKDLLESADVRHRLRGLDQCRQKVEPPAKAGAQR
ncbi:4-alpha-glucanotransferase [Hydrocarboniclastica marina]|uniref:4-alpha-glucanotransferase n=1 Tax=Hydrocarboniclastica marina TaxID=2259620 RepID=A0A4P7XG66_9ALTE|nr:4-alpha-glucanotransferase [Hydrocarboniclastica marina]QCF25979.1 4-alpha-glucanotransferase [Hydrocarboniclastica marina]